MAARTSVPNLRQQEQTRAAIQTTQLVKRLQHYALGEKDEQKADVDLDAGKLRAIEILLRKTLPDLSAVSVDASVEHEAGDSIKALMDAVNGLTRSK